MRLFLFVLFIFGYLFSYSQCSQKVTSESKKTYIKGEKFYKKRNIKESLSFLHKSINYDKNNASAYFLLGQIYYERDQFDKSEYFFLKGVDLCPSYSSSVYFMLYDINIKSNQYDKAKDNLLIYLKFLDLSKDERDNALVSLKEVILETHCLETLFLLIYLQLKVFQLNLMKFYLYFLLITS